MAKHKLSNTFLIKESEKYLTLTEFAAHSRHYQTFILRSANVVKVMNRRIKMGKRKGTKTTKYKSTSYHPDLTFYQKSYQDTERYAMYYPGHSSKKPKLVGRDYILKRVIPTIMTAFRGSVSEWRKVNGDMYSFILKNKLNYIIQENVPLIRYSLINKDLRLSIKKDGKRYPISEDSDTYMKYKKFGW